MNNQDSQPDSDDEPFVLGQQLADAREADKRHSKSGTAGNSPLPETEYDSWRGDLSLIRPTPNRLDREIRVVCKRYAQSDADERFKVRHSISMDQFYTLINFAKRTAIFGIREGKADLVADGLTAVAMIEQDRVDFRDILWCLGLLYHAADKSGGNGHEMFRSAAALAEPAVAEFFINFTERPPEYRHLRDAWGYDEVETDDGVGFLAWGFGKYNPRIDLKSTIIDISKLVAPDYQPDAIEVATDLPDVWFGGQEDANSKRVFSKVRACASIHAKLRPDKHSEHNSQGIIVFLAEAANESDAQSLCRMAENNESPRFGQLVLARSRLVCAMIGRSFMVGIDDYETTESLTRFSDGLAAILERHSGIEKAK